MTRQRSQGANQVRRVHLIARGAGLTTQARQERRLAQLARRRHFIRVERLSLAEASYIAPDFDPGQEYDPA